MLQLGHRKVLMNFRRKERSTWYATVIVWSSSYSVHVIISWLSLTDNRYTCIFDMISWWDLSYNTSDSANFDCYMRLWHEFYNVKCLYFVNLFMCFMPSSN